MPDEKWNLRNTERLLLSGARLILVGAAVAAMFQITFANLFSTRPATVVAEPEWASTLRAEVAGLAEASQRQARELERVRQAAATTKPLPNETLTRNLQA